ncbi:MAG: hypothetical protein O9331_07205, partial [Acidovorax sp.]|nr:hypothetical protein [Acidovorax sp.]
SYGFWKEVWATRPSHKQHWGAAVDAALYPDLGRLLAHGAPFSKPEFGTATKFQYANGSGTKSRRQRRFDEGFP